MIVLLGDHKHGRLGVERFHLGRHGAGLFRHFAEVLGR